jgi:hypothetical protein
MTDAIGPAALAHYGLAARLLGWRAPDFWAATPAELAAALAPPSDSASLDRDTFNRMMEQQDGRL